MMLSEAVKAAGIGGQIYRIGNMDPVSVWKDGLGGTVGYLNYAGLTADDWQVVQRAPREWLVCPGCGVASVQGRLVRGHLPHACHEKAIRVREVVE